MKFSITHLMILMLLFPSIAFADNAVVVLYKSGCRSYFIADGVNGYYLLEWYGGYDPNKGDVIIGNLNFFGLQDVYYPKQNQVGRVYVDDYGLTEGRVLEKYSNKCN